MYLRKSPIWKGEVGDLVCVESIQTLFDGLTICLYDLCDTASLIISLPHYGVKPTGLPVIGSYLVLGDIQNRQTDGSAKPSWSERVRRNM